MNGDICYPCAGTGEEPRDPEEPPRTCKYCDGAGKIEERAKQDKRRTKR